MVRAMGRPVDVNVVLLCLESEPATTALRVGRNAEMLPQRASHLRGLLHDPRAITRERCHAGETAAALAVAGPGRPAHHADHRERAADLAKHRRAGIAGAG